MSSPHGHGLRLLCIDGGGVRGIVPLRVLESICNYARIDEFHPAPEPFEFFDLICGTSTGGIIALLLGILKVPLQECIRLYETLGEEVFSKGLLQNLAGEAIAFAVYKSLYKHEVLEQIVKNETARVFNNENLMLSDERVRAGTNRTPYVFVVSKRSASDSTPFLFRNYNAMQPNGTTNAMVWQAARATSAAPSFFPSIVIDDFSYIDGGVGNNNPTRIAKRECKNVRALENRQIDVIVSLGTGVPKFELVQPLFKNPASAVGQLMNYLTNVATDSEKIHSEIAEEHFDLNLRRGRYFRFNLGSDVGSVNLDDADLIKWMGAATQAYICKPETDKTLRELITLMNRTGSATSSLLSASGSELHTIGIRNMHLSGDAVFAPSATSTVQLLPETTSLNTAVMKIDSLVMDGGEFRGNFSQMIARTLSKN